MSATKPLDQTLKLSKEKKLPVIRQCANWGTSQSTYRGPRFKYESKRGFYWADVSNNVCPCAVCQRNAPKQ